MIFGKKLVLKSSVLGIS